MTCASERVCLVGPVLLRNAASCAAAASSSQCCSAHALRADLVSERKRQTRSPAAHWELKLLSPLLSSLLLCCADCDCCGSLCNSIVGSSLLLLDSHPLLASVAGETEHSPCPVHLRVKGVWTRMSSNCK